MSPTGGSVFASALYENRWPELEPATLDHIADLHRSWARQLTEAADASDQVYRPEFSTLLVGQAGDALLTSLGKDVNSWLSDAAAHQRAATSVSDAADYLRGLRIELTDIVNAGEPAYDAAVSHRDPAAANAILAEAKSQADAAVNHAVGRISSTLDGKFGTAPASTNSGAHAVLTSAETGGPQANNQQASDGSQGVTSAGGTQQQVSAGNPTTGGSASHPGAGGANPGSVRANPNGINPSATSTNGPGEPALVNGVYGQPDAEQVQTPPVTQSSPLVTPMPTAVSSGASPSASSTPASSGASTPALSSTLGSGQNSASASTTPAEALAPAPADPSSGVATASGAGGSGSGVVSGMGTSGALSSAMVPPQLSAGQVQPAVAAFAPAPGMADAATTGTASNLSSPPPMGVVLGSDGGYGAVSAGAAGGVTVPTPSAPGPLAPYSPPAAGSLSSAQPPSTPAAPLGPPPVGPTAGGAGAFIAGSGGADRGAAPTKRVNPDLVSAQRVLAGLVKACPARPIFWAVSVLQTPVGPQTLIAGSVGGGGYLPPEVSVPSTVRLAVLDPALPSGWAAAWMGWQSPLAILVDHYEGVAKVVAGVTVSAMMTSELWPKRPDCGGDFSAVNHEELVMSTAPPLVGGHRLTATDPALAARLMALDRGGDITNFVAAQLTRAVWTAAAQPDDTGLPIAVKEDADILALVAEGAAGREHWDNYRQDVERRADGAVMMPEIHAPCDADDSPGSVTARMWYRHYYARGRIAEMVTCWASQPVSILDIAYCGVAAGFGAVIAAVVAELEKRRMELAGSAGGT